MPEVQDVLERGEETMHQVRVGPIEPVSLPFTLPLILSPSQKASVGTIPVRDLQEVCMTRRGVEGHVKI